MEYGPRREASRSSRSMKDGKDDDNGDDNDDDDDDDDASAVLMREYCIYLILHCISGTLFE